ncbi:nascent polypeptide-associated complex subunit alpha, muscle-specific form-like isoform X2 [Gymnodraco acuticeps]|uniref:Nascent polypeptide-associated complex subunit alpha, muscle-specific form-like isoform X2 n=1 Tax=Gymnodraco acuticeps TaxID=8218 RepID=A0A6P8UWM7_GYMAC|nr:nascent polypeptide-associated complex subunit alpha, muscle-specific form-like isoform X2 [Gymnodraco acuticeps]
MALSQVQCLDDNNVNLRTTESKPEFLYSEDQRVALEAFLRDGREAFVKYLEARTLRGFLSDLELDSLADTVEPYDPGTDIFLEDGEDDQSPLSLHYWPELSDRSIPQMDLGWPDCASYRGVTRTAVYTQPPLDDQAHIKEVVRKMIAQAQKNLRVRCTDGAEFYTRSCTKIRGRMGHRFMFIDGDKAVSGSYSFTWSASRLDRNLITVVTGQAVESFDKLFRVLYATSNSVDLRKDAIEPEPEAEPIPAPAAVVPPSAEMVRKLYSAKYVALGNPYSTPPPKTNNPEDSKNQGTKKRGGKEANKESTQEAPPIHPGLIDLEKVCMMSYLPTWPEPDPPSDVIGFINIRDNKKQNQVHLQRSEMYETSQAVRFSSPFSKAKETLPDVAKPRDFTTKQKEVNELQPAKDKTKTEEVVVGVAQQTKTNKGPSEIKSKTEEPVKKLPASGPQCESNKHTTTTPNTEKKQHSNTFPKQDAGHNNTPHLNAHTPPQSRSSASTPNSKGSSQTTQTVTTLSESHTKTEVDSILNTQQEVVSRKQALKASCTQVSHLHSPTEGNTEPHPQTKTVLPHSQSQADHTQSQNSSEITPIIQTPTINSHKSSPQTVSSTSLSENSHVSITTSKSPKSSISSSSIPPPALSLSPASPSETSTPPIPKPRTVHLVIKGDVTYKGQEILDISVVPMAETSTAPEKVINARTVATTVTTLPQKVPELQNNSAGEVGAQRMTKDILNMVEAPQQKQSGTSQNTINEKAVGGDDRAGMQSIAGNKAKSDVLITKVENVITQEVIPKSVKPKTLVSMDVKVTPQKDSVATVKKEMKAPEQVSMDVSGVTNEKTEDVTECKTYLAKVHVPQRISYSELPAPVNNVSDTVDSLKAPTHTPISATHIFKDSAGDSTHTVTHNQQGNASLTPERPTDSMPDTAKHNTHNNIEEKPSKAPGGTHTPEKPLRLHLSEIHTPDLLSPTSERGLQSLMALTRSATPDGFLPRTPTPDFCTPPSDSHTYTPDFRTPTPDGYLSPRTDSALSTTSEEFYECCDSPFQEPVLERLASLNHAMTEEHNNTNNANATSPVYINSNSPDGTLGTIDRYTSSTETESLERKRSSTGDIQPTKERPDTEKAGDSVERMGRPQAADGLKLSHTSPEFQRGRQQASKAFSSYRPTRPFRVLSPNWAMGPHPSRQQNQAESNVLPDNAFFPRSPPSRLPPPLKAGAVGPATRQAEVSQSQQRFFSRQPPAAQDRTRAGQTQNPSPYSKPQGSFLLPQSNREAPLHSQTQNQAGSPQEEGNNPFSVTFSRLYSLKGLKEKMSKLPAQSKRGSGSSHGQRR